MSNQKQEKKEKELPALSDRDDDWDLGMKEHLADEIEMGELTGAEADRIYAARKRERRARMRVFGE